MTGQGGYENESKKSIIDLLRFLPSYNYRSIGGRLDLFFSSIDLFIYLSRRESTIFERISIKGNSFEETLKIYMAKYRLDPRRATEEINSFLKNLLESVKNE